MSKQPVRVKKGTSGTTILEYGGKSYGVNEYKYKMGRGELPKIDVDAMTKPMLNKAPYLKGTKIK